MVDTLNVWEERLPAFDQEAIGAKYKGVNKEPMDQAETAVWVKIQELAERLQKADGIVLGVPMWNFAYPYKLKQLIDLACQRHMLFTWPFTCGVAVALPRSSREHGHHWTSIGASGYGPWLASTCAA